MWRISEIHEDKSYVLCLCHSPESKRFFRMVEVDQPRDPDTVFVTSTVPTELLRKRDFTLIAQLVPLSSGGAVSRRCARHLVHRG